MTKHDRSHNLLDSAIEKFKAGSYTAAIKEFNEYLAIHEEWLPYQYLAWSLHLTGQYRQAIEAFNKSIAIHEDWESYQGLGYVTSDAAIHTGYRSIQQITCHSWGLADIQRSWIGATSLQQYKEAIEAFNKSTYSRGSNIQRSWDGIASDAPIHTGYRSIQQITCYSRRLVL